jgi:hypothetical protein
MQKPVIQELKNRSYYTIQLDESRDVANLAILCLGDIFMGVHFKIC